MRPSPFRKRQLFDICLFYHAFRVDAETSSQIRRRQTRNPRINRAGILQSMRERVATTSARCFSAAAIRPTNLQISDLEVYWLLVGQLIREAKGLPSGTSVRVREVPLLALSGAASGTFKQACPSSDARL